MLGCIRHGGFGDSTISGLGCSVKMLAWIRFLVFCCDVVFPTARITGFSKTHIHNPSKGKACRGTCPSMFMIVL